MSNYMLENQNSKSFYNMAWIAFALSFTGMGVGTLYMQTELAMKGFLLMSYLFSVTACFTLSKVIRDKHETENQMNTQEGRSIL